MNEDFVIVKVEVKKGTGIKLLNNRTPFMDSIF